MITNTSIMLIDSQNQSISLVTVRPAEDLIDAKTMYIARLILLYILQLIIKTMGAGTNILSIITFIKSRLNDSISVSFLVLSVSDLGYIIMVLVIRILGLLRSEGVIELPWELLYMTSIYGLYFQDVSTLITLYVAVQKCCCVALPYIFKNIFTVPRAWICIAFMHLAMLAFYIPIFNSMTFTYQFSPSTNRTRLTANRRSYFYQVMDIWRSFSRVFLFIASQVILLVCLVIMVVKFKESVRFRNTLGKDISHDAEHQETDKNKESAKMGPKERRALSAVIIVSAMYVLSTLPYTVMYVVILIYPPYMARTDLMNVRTIASNCQTILTGLSASLNFFIYFHYNSKFRATFHAIFHTDGVFPCSEKRQPQ